MSHSHTICNRQSPPVVHIKGPYSVSVSERFNILIKCVLFYSTTDFGLHREGQARSPIFLLVSLCFLLPEDQRDEGIALRTLFYSSLHQTWNLTLLTILDRESGLGEEEGSVHCWFWVGDQLEQTPFNLGPSRILGSYRFLETRRICTQTHKRERNRETKRNPFIFLFPNLILFFTL